MNLARAAVRARQTWGHLSRNSTIILWQQTCENGIFEVPIRSLLIDFLQLFML